MKKYTLISLNDILGGGYNQAQIEEAFKKFSCQREPDLENFLVSKAISYENINYGKTYLCLDETALQNQEFTIMAYFTLAQKSVSIENISQKKRRKMLGEYPGRDHIDSIPAYLIGQLGRDGSHIIYANGAYNNEEDDIGKLMHDFRCTKPEDMYYGVLSDRVRYFKETKGGQMCIP